MIETEATLWVLAEISKRLRGARSEGGRRSNRFNKDGIEYSKHQKKEEIRQKTCHVFT